MKSFDNRAWQIIGDGKKTALIMPDYGIYVLEKPIITSFEIDMPFPLEVHSAFGNRSFIPSHLNRGFDIKINLWAKDAESREGDTRLLDFGLVNRMTVTELFQAIRKKINERR